MCVRAQCVSGQNEIKLPSKPSRVYEKNIRDVTWAINQEHEGQAVMQSIKLYLAILLTLAISACGGGGGGTTDTTLPKISAVSPATNVIATGKLNDTGQTASQCYRAGSDVLTNCDSLAMALNNAQDGMVGRDANLSTNSNSDGKLGFSFTKVSGGCVLDNVTGLTWEGKTTDGGLRDYSKTYTNYSPTYDPSHLYGTSTDASGFVKAVNASNLCGYSDWRLSTADELQSIVDYSVALPGPAIDASVFPATPNDEFWSGSGDIINKNFAWSVSFKYGDGGPLSRDLKYYVRLVRASPSPATPARYTLSTDGQEVIDIQTNLIWRRCPEGMVASGGACTGNAITFTHEQALQRATAQAGSTGAAWRLPNIKELSSIADKNNSNPAIDPTAFPTTPSNDFWSASPGVGVGLGLACGVSFADGGFGYGGRANSNYVRLVRTAQ